MDKDSEEMMEALEEEINGGNVVEFEAPSSDIEISGTGQIEVSTDMDPDTPLHVYQTPSERRLSTWKKWRLWFLFFVLLAVITALLYVLDLGVRFAVLSMWTDSRLASCGEKMAVLMAADVICVALLVVFTTLFLWRVINVCKLGKWKA